MDEDSKMNNVCFLVEIVPGNTQQSGVGFFVRLKMWVVGGG